jgi:hypothetical protein
MLAWIIAALAAGIYCVVRAILDLRQRRYAWSAVGFLCAAGLLLTPIQTHAVKYDVPFPSSR